LVDLISPEERQRLLDLVNNRVNLNMRDWLSNTQQLVTDLEVLPEEGDNNFDNLSEEHHS
jgi:hypothetical protein